MERSLTHPKATAAQTHLYVRGARMESLRQDEKTVYEWMFPALRGFTWGCEGRLGESAAGKFSDSEVDLM